MPINAWTPPLRCYWICNRAVHTSATSTVSAWHVGAAREVFNSVAQVTTCCCHAINILMPQSPTSDTLHVLGLCVVRDSCALGVSEHIFAMGTNLTYPLAACVQ